MADEVSAVSRFINAVSWKAGRRPWMKLSPIPGALQSGSPKTKGVIIVIVPRLTGATGL